MFSEDGEKEFKTVFGEKRLYENPTTYINITSKVTPTFATAGCENWFVKANVPHNASARPEYVQEKRKHIVDKINRGVENEY